MSRGSGFALNFIALVANVVSGQIGLIAPPDRAIGCCIGFLLKRIARGTHPELALDGPSQSPAAAITLAAWRRSEQLPECVIAQRTL